MDFFQPLSHFLRAFDLKATGKWLVLSALIGVVAGLGCIVFTVLSQLVVHWTLVEIADYAPGEAGGAYHMFGEHGPDGFVPGLIILVMIGGGLLSGFLVYTFAPEAEGHGTDAAIDAFHNKRGVVRNRIPIIKTVASAITIGTGGSGGREGPIAQIGAGFGSFLATQLKLSARDRRLMVAVGVGAGIGSIFRAPLAGALFAGEILYKEAELESDVIVPAAMAAIIGYSVYSFFLPEPVRFAPLFLLPPEVQETMTMTSPVELIPYGLLAIILVAVGIVYIKVFYGIQDLFKKLPIMPHFRPAIGAGLAGLFAVGLFSAMDNDPRILRGVLATGYGSLQEALNPNNGIGIQVLLLIALGKVLTTSLTISSGGSGGVFGPSMVIGGCLGAACGQYFYELWPNLVLHPEAYAIVGMAGFFAGCAHAPISTIIMVSELTNGYQLLIPAMWVSTLCYVLCRPWTLYKMQVPTRIESPAHRGDFIVDVLEGIKVGDVQRRNGDIMYIPESMSLEEIVHTLAETHQHYFPVVDDHGKMVGIFSADDVRSYLYDETIWNLAVARDIMVGNFVSVTPEDDLNTALQRFTSLNLDELPVMDPDEPGKLLGMLRRKETIAFYNRRLMQHKQDRGEDQPTSIPA